MKRHCRQAKISTNRDVLGVLFRDWFKHIFTELCFQKLYLKNNSNSSDDKIVILKTSKKVARMTLLDITSSSLTIKLSHICWISNFCYLGLVILQEGWEKFILFIFSLFKVDIKRQTVYHIPYGIPYTIYHFILLQINPFDLRVDREGWWFEHSVS